MKYNVDHILLKHKYEAEDVLRLLQSGKLFTDLAEKYSQCSSSQRGGSLGVVDGGQLDGDFEEALSALKEGEVTSIPVRTRFGYHIIRRNSLK